EGKKSIPIELFVGSDDHRGREGLCYELSLKPMASDRKIAVIDDVHLMQSESANSLLKTLEEPPPKSLIVLITDRDEAILPTIRS
ncbi:AAA family ATPase, partial [Enterococcus hirae]